ncbi:MAG: response regulator [Bacillota bacterium]
MNDRIAERSLLNFIANSPDAVLIIADGVILECNAAAVKILDATDRQSLIGVPPSALSPEFQSDGRSSHEKAQEMIALALDNGSHRFEWQHTKFNGEILPVEVTLTTIDDADSPVLHVHWRNLTEQQAALSELKEREEYRRLLFESSPWPIFIIGNLDSEPSFIDCNPAGVKITHSPSKSDVVGKTAAFFSAALQYDDVPLAEALHKQVGECFEKGSVVFDWRQQGFDGAIWDSCVHMLHFNYQGKDYLQLTENDVTEQRAAQRAILKAKEAAEAASKVKTDFLANMSHEFRTPMNAVLGLTYLLLQDQLTEKQQHFLKLIELSAHNLMEIINDVLDFSKMEAGKLAPKQIEFGIDEVLNNLETIALAKTAAKDRLEIIFDIRPGVPARLIGDPLRLGQVLINITGNAIKFTDEGCVIVKLEIVNDDADKVEVLFSVKDTGIGMTAGQQSQLFQSFFQADTSSTRKYGGAGLGLTISQGLVELMGGKIGVESEYGVGSEFCFTLPFAKVSGRPAAVSGPAQQPELPDADGLMLLKKDIQGATVLLVEDNSINQEVAAEILQQLGLNVVLASDGQVALDKIATQDFDLVLMDIQMPVLDGIEATKRIRKTKTLAELPIVAMTAHALASEVEKSISAGMNDYLTKPVDPDSLFRTLAKWIAPGARPVAQIVPVAEAPALIVDLTKLTTIDTEIGLARLGVKPAVYGGLLRAFYRENKNGAALLKKAWATDDSEAASRIAHTIKGTAGNIGAVRLYEAATKLEGILKNRKNRDPGALLMAFELELVRVLEELKQFVPPPVTALYPEVADRNPEELPMLLLELERYIAINRPKQCREALAKIAALRLTESTGRKIAELSEVINLFDLDVAGTLLQALVKDLASEPNATV